MRAGRARRALPIVAVAATVLVAGSSLAAYAAYLGTVGSIHHLNVGGLGHRPKAYNSAENILVIGAYDNVKDYTSATYRPTADNGADTYVLVHVAPDHKGAVMLSFPRDTMVPVYACPASSPFPGQQAQPGVLEPLNQTYSLGGPGCAWESLEQQTGIRIDHFLEIDYLGFEKFVGAIGGADVCLPYPVNVPRDGLHLAAGRHHIDAAQALQFVRARDIGQWSDLQRIKRQQFFMISVMQSALRQGLLGDPVKLLSVAHTVAPYLTTDTGFNLTAMYDLARSMQGTNLSKVQLIEAPVIPYPPDMNRVEWQQPQAAQLFAAVAHDRTPPKPSRHPSHRSAGAVSPGKVRVAVLNGDGVLHAAATAGNALASAGFTVTGTGNASGFGYRGSVVEYSRAADLAAARTLARAVPGAQLRQVASVPGGTVTLIVGTGFHLRGGAPARTQAPSVSGLAQSYGGVTGNQSICQDAGAFSG